MDKAEYDKKMGEIKANFEKEKQGLYREYIEANRKFKVGDIIHNTQTDVIIAVERIGGFISNGLPEPVYNGKALTKKLLPMKKNSDGSIYGDSHVKHLGYDN